jgi:hypothetical protein
MIQQSGDIALIYRPGIFAWIERLYADKFKEGAQRATHGFYIKGGGKISEANGFSIHESEISVYQKPGIKMWVFRYSPLNTAALMDAYVAASENGDARYSWSGIWDFAKSFFTGKRTFKDPKGEFCTDYTGEIIKSGGLPYISSLEPWEVDPTTQLNWFLGTEAKNLGWNRIL